MGWGRRSPSGSLGQVKRSVRCWRRPDWWWPGIGARAGTPQPDLRQERAGDRGPACQEGARGLAQAGGDALGAAAGWGQAGRACGGPVGGRPPSPNKRLHLTPGSPVGVGSACALPLPGAGEAQRWAPRAREAKPRGNSPGQKVLRPLGGHLSTRGSTTRHRTTFRHRMQAPHRAEGLPPRPGQVQRGACDATRPAPARTGPPSSQASAGRDRRVGEARRAGGRWRVWLSPAPAPGWGRAVARGKGHGRWGVSHRAPGREGSWART